ncbi:HigA family addiction module antitoxin [Desulfobacula sp.]|uniref:HigA family addiction module antitoxin n=1 Tax=Desulfobacula sp. TaxID=2593537 RepID=UPI0025BECAFE|nr:HigA family addiction module antitoxin [Desulfobacula sp.]MBC2704196.1 HigA family addiction module antidote protein [Desulfobacula sp.]
MKKIKPVHPGEILLEEFIKPLGISQYRLAKDINVSQMKISEIVNKKRRVTVDTALRLSKYFGVSPEFWMGIQNDYDIENAMDNKEVYNTIEKIQPLENMLHA